MTSPRTTVTACWPFTPLGVKIEVEVPETYELDGVGFVVNELVASLWWGTAIGRILAALGFRK